MFWFFLHFSKGLSEFAFDPHGEVEAVSEDVASLPGDVALADLQDISDGDMDAPDGELLRGEGV